MLVLLLLAGTATIQVCIAFSVTKQTGKSAVSLVPRITLDEYLTNTSHDDDTTDGYLDITQTPVIIRDIISPQAVESLADELIGILGDEEIQMQRKIKDDEDGSSSTTEIYDINVMDAVEYMMDSHHYDSYFAFCEGLLPGSTSDSTQLHDKLTNIRELPFPNQENWFTYFLSQVMPSDAVILAGTGATSTLHRDPFEWTGTSVCFEGTKIWRFILPPPHGVTVVDEALQSYRLDSIAWEEEDDDDDNKQKVVLSAGWQSDMSLFDTVDDNFPSVLDLVTLEEENNEQFQRLMEDIGTDISSLQPSTNALDALDRIAKAHGSNGASNLPFITAIQQPGDLLLIPAHCWHQTYAPMPSVAVASQRCGAMNDGARVIQHVLDVANRKDEVPDILKCDTYEEGMGKEVVRVLFDTILTNDQ